MLKKAFKLKNTKIFIAHDLCPEDRKDRKLLSEHLKIAKSQNFLTKIRGNKLVVGEDVYTIDQLKEMNLISQEKKEIDPEEKQTLQTNKSNSAPCTPSANENPDKPDVTSENPRETIISCDQPNQPTHANYKRLNSELDQVNDVQQDMKKTKPTEKLLSISTNKNLTVQKINTRSNSSSSSKQT